MDNCAITWDTVNVTVIQDCASLLPTKEIPNVFTPNGDGVNDLWAFNLGFGNELKDLTIVNRWGNLIKNSTLKHMTYMSWNGRTNSGEACSDGVYFYTLEYTDVKGDTHKMNSYITLIR